MKSSTAFFIGIGAGAGLFAVVALTLHQKSRSFEIRTEDLGYQEHSRADLAAEHLLDLNMATRADLLSLRLSTDESERILENRPYRNKLELVSRMVIPEETYNSIKNHIGVAGATESVKVAL